MSCRGKNMVVFLRFLILVVASSVTQTSFANAQENLVLCTNGFRSLNGGDPHAFTQAILFRTSDLKFKTEDEWKYELNCSPQTCDISLQDNSVLIEKTINQGNELYRIQFDQPNMEIVLDRIRLTHTEKKTSHIEFQCEWFDP